MLSKILKIFLLLNILCAQLSFGQQFKDCETAFNLCGESPFLLSTETGIGTNDSFVDNTCVLGELNSIWLTWEITEGGLLTFELTANQIGDDIDFLLFKTSSTDICGDKELIRCMASGENIGAPAAESEICLGPTGLAIGETDVEEAAGCSPNDNNFLAPIETLVGEQYLLLINHNGTDDLGFTATFGGEASLNCTTVPINDLSINTTLDFNLFPSITNTCLLYTSPSPRDGLLSRMPSSA